MLTIKSNALTEKGVMRPAVRTAIRKAISGINIELANGSVVELEPKGNGVYFAQIAVDADGVVINSKVELTITANDYKEPVKKTATPKEPESIDIE